MYAVNSGGGRPTPDVGIALITVTMYLNYIYKRLV